MTNAQDADWAPDGQRLVFTSSGDLFIGDGARFHQSTTSREFVEQDPQWSPDGQTIAAMSIDERDPKIYEPSDELLLLDAASGRSRILRGPYGAWSPTWRPSAEPVPGQRRCVVEGTRRGDLLLGTRRGDLIYGRGGNDLISSEAGNDVVFGNAGADVLLAGGGNDVLGAQDNRRDLVDGGAGSDRTRVDRRRDRLRSIERLLP